MKALDLLNRLIESSGVRRENTVDRVICGDPGKEIRTALTCWICSLEAAKAAAADGYDAVVTHEPTFYFHRNEWENAQALEDGSVMKAAVMEKHRLLEERGITVLRVHDSWDVRPGIGMADAWAAALGFGEPTAYGSDGFQRRYDIEPMTLDGLARRVAARTAALGEPLVQVIGQGSQTVSKVCLGPGYASTVQVAKEMGCDVNILCDDGSLFWMDIQCAVDLGHPLIRVNHGTSEEPGSSKMADYINAQPWGIRARHFRHRPYYHYIGQE